MMNRANVQTLARYQVDRADGITATGPEKLIILTLRSNESSEEFCVAISKIDAMIISLKLSGAASEVQSEDSKAG